MSAKEVHNRLEILLKCIHSMFSSFDVVPTVSLLLVSRAFVVVMGFG